MDHRVKPGGECVRQSVWSAWWESVPCEVTAYVVEGNCVAEGRGGEQPEANDQSIIKKMMNSIRPDAMASLLF